MQNEQLIITPEFLQSQGFSPTFPERYWKKVGKDGANGCWTWKGSLRHGYGQLGTVDGATPISAHRASWILHFGPIPNGLWVLHKCDNPPCSNPAHLFLGDHAANMDDKKRKGRNSTGEQHGGHKLTQAQVDKIRELSPTMSTGEIARMFSVSQGTAWEIVNGKIWKESFTQARRDALRNRPNFIPRGEKQNRAKLNDENVSRILSLRGTVSINALAEMFNISRGAIEALLRGVTWKHVPRPITCNEL